MSKAKKLGESSKNEKKRKRGRLGGAFTSNFLH